MSPTRRRLHSMSCRAVHRIHLLLVAVLLLPGVSFATTLNVSAPEVKEGAGVVEYRTGIDFADEENRRQSVSEYLHVDYGLNDTLALRLAGSGRKRGADDMEYAATQAEARLQLFEDEVSGFDGALRFSYQLADGDDKPDTLGVAWLAQHRVAAFTLTYNLTLSHQLGEDRADGLLGDARWQVTAPLPETSLQLGLEGFHNVGELGDMGGWNTQQHRIGPVLKGKLTDGVGFQLGYLTAISAAAPEQAVKLFVSWGF